MYSIEVTFFVGLSLIPVTCLPIVALLQGIDPTKLESGIRRNKARFTGNISDGT